MAQRQTLSMAQRHALNVAVAARAADFNGQRLSYEQMAAALAEGLGFRPTRNHVVSAIAATGVAITLDRPLLGGQRKAQSETRDVVESLVRWALLLDAELSPTRKLPACVREWVERRDRIKAERRKGESHGGGPADAS